MKVSKFTTSMIAPSITSSFAVQAANDPNDPYIIKVENNNKSIIRYIYL